MSCPQCHEAQSWSRIPAFQNFVCIGRLWYRLHTCHQPLFFRENITSPFFSHSPYFKPFFKKYSSLCTVVLNYPKLRLLKGELRKAITNPALHMTYLLKCPRMSFSVFPSAWYHWFIFSMWFILTARSLSTVLLVFSILFLCILFFSSLNIVLGLCIYWISSYWLQTISPIYQSHFEF